MTKQYSEEELNTYLSQAELSRKLDVTRAYIAKLVKNGTLKLLNKKIKLSDALQQIKSNSNPAYSGKIVNNLEKKEKEVNAIISHLSHLDFNEARTLKERYLAGMAELEYLEKQKKLVDIEQVKKESFYTARKLRDNLFNISERLADILSAETNAVKIREMLNNEVRTVLEEVVKELEKNG
jgi:transcriptional regulator with XRE-family HTH domain